MNDPVFGGFDPSEPRDSPDRPPRPVSAADVPAGVAEALADDQPILAIKRYREHFGVGLPEAKEAVERIRDGRPVPAVAEADATADGDLEDRVRELVVGPGKIAAIKLYRERTGAGLKEAKEAVEAQMRREGLQSAGGCASIVLLAVGTALAATWLAWTGTA